MAKVQLEEDTELEDRGDLYVADDEELEEDGMQDEDEEEASDEEVDDEEDLEEEEDDESEGDEDEDEEEDEDDEEDARIPRSRLNQVIEQREAERERADAAFDRIETLEEQLLAIIDLQKQNMQQTTPTPVAEKPKFNFRQKFKEANEALLEGDLDKNSDIMLEIEEARSAELQEALKQTREGVSKEAKTEATASLEEVRFERVISKATEEYAFLDDTSDDYNEKAVKMVNAIMSGHVAQGETKSKALQAALDDVVPMFAEADTKAPTKEPLGKARTKAARKKAAKASQQQPPETRRAARGKAARNLDEIDVTKMSDAEYGKLSLRERKKLRGD